MTTATEGRELTILSVVVAMVAAEITARLLQAESNESLMLCAVISTAWLGGFGPTLLAIILALCAFHYNLASQSNSFGWRHDFLHVALWKCRVCYCLPFNLFVAFVITAHRKATELIRRSQVAVEDQQQVEAALLCSENYLTEAQRLSRKTRFGWNGPGTPFQFVFPVYQENDAL